MADCSASGTAVDRATRALIGNANTQKQFGSLLGHAALAQNVNTAAIPATRPDQIALPNGSGDVNLLAAGIPQSQHMGQPMRMVPNTVHQHQHQHQHQPIPALMQQQQQQQMHHQQQHMNMMMQLQQQQAHMMMIQQQQNLMAAQQAAQQQQQQAAQATQEEVDKYTVEGVAKGVSVEELAAAWAEAQAEDENQVDGHGHEGTVKGASMEELAAAWAEAQEDYYQSEDFIDPSDYYAGEETEQAATYRFVNQMDVNKNDVPPNTNFMEEGMQHFDEGRIAQAIKSFESELQLNNPDNATAWRMLGRCHAENDQDREAIVCLETAVEKDPYCAESMLALGVSYVNELNHAKALAILKNWITMNPKYAGMEVPAAHDDLYGDHGTHNDEADFNELQNLLLAAVEYDGSDAADVWEALGVAANVSRDFETAVESFQKAIEARPDDYQLWNKLGATLANSGQSDKALPAYHKAIQLKPKYARAWLNMAISHSNLREFDEAARCYLQTLSLNPGAVHCWSYLRVALSCSEKWDLIPFAASQNLEAFRDHYDFVMGE